MNKEYMRTSDMVIISTDEGLKKKQINNNITEILETENNIEEMELIQERVRNKELFDYKDVLDFCLGEICKKSFLIYAPISLVIVIVSLITNHGFLAAVLTPTIFVAPCLIAPIVAIFKAPKSHDLMHEKATEILDKTIESEKEKLTQLNQKTIMPATKVLETADEPIKINKTELIKNLKTELELIRNFVLNNKKYINYYENNNLYVKLSSKGFSKKSISIIEELIKNEMSETTIVKENGPVLRKTKNSDK